MDNVFDLDGARQRAKKDKPFSTEAGLDEPYKKSKRKSSPPPSDEVMEAFFEMLNHRHPWKMKQLRRIMEWLDEEGRKAGVWA